MPAPQPLSNELQDRAGADWVRRSEFELRGVLRDAGTAIQRTRDPEILDGLHTAAGIACVKLGHFAEAKDHFVAATLFGPHDPHGFVNTAAACLGLGNPREALDHLLTAADLLGDDAAREPHFALTLAEALWRSGCRGEALSVLGEAEAAVIEALNPLGHYWLADVYAQMGEFGPSIAHFGTFLSLQFGPDPARSTAGDTLALYEAHESDVRMTDSLSRAIAYRRELDEALAREPEEGDLAASVAAAREEARLAMLPYAARATAARLDEGS